MNETLPTETEPRPLHAIWKWLGVLVAALVASAAFEFYERGGLSTSPAAMGRLLGGALTSFGIAMLFAIFVRGGAGLFVGIVVVAVMSFFQWQGASTGHSAPTAPDRQFTPADLPAFSDTQAADSPTPEEM